MGDGRIRTLRRIGRRGLSSACIEGMLASSAPFVAVIDADLQHDPALLDRMLDVLRQGTADLVVGSRYVTGGSIGEWGGSRAFLSRFATRVTQHVSRLGLTDPMSGYFALRRERLDEVAPKLSGRGFKILLDLLLSADRPWRGKELPLAFGIRTAGQSKLSASVAWQCALLLAEKTLGRYMPVRMIAFGLVGAVGVGVHFAVLSTLLFAGGARFTIAQTVATCTAIIANFGINNLFTHSDRTLTGRDWWRGLASFALICGFGAVANVGIASFLFSRNMPWTLASLAGIAVSAAWNYAMSARYTWRVGDAC
jgi:dolichol-phosphate mannosyltransferase